MKESFHSYDYIWYKRHYSTSNSLESSPNSDINHLWARTSTSCNIQYDQYRNTKQVLHAIQTDNENHLHHELKSQGFIISSIILRASSNTRRLWSKLQKSMPRNIFSYTIKYLNNTLATKKNLCKWPLSSSSACSFYLQFESLQHIVSSCKCYREDGRYTWRRNSVLLHISRTLSLLQDSSLYADLPSFPFPSLITGDSLRPDLVLVLNSTAVHLLELTVGFESNLTINSERKSDKYRPLILALQEKHYVVKFINISMSALGMFGTSSDSFSSILKGLHFDTTRQQQIIMKASNIAIRCTYFIFCKRNKSWPGPELHDF